MRHVKCDETPGMCQRCTSTGRKCDGYDSQRLPSRRTTGALTELAPGIAHRFRWKLTSDEKRCISFFQNRVGPSIVGYFDCVLWQRLVLQLSQSEPAAFHAVVAFSAVYADYETRGLPRKPDEMDNSLQRFALDQCARAYSRLNSRSASQDPGLRDITLVCCVLFVMIEWMRGQYTTASIHMKNGLRIIQQDQTLTAASAAFSSVLSQCIADSLASLNIQSTYFGIDDLTQQPQPPQTPPQSDPPTPTSPPDSPSTPLDDKTFHTLLDARLTFEPLISEIFHFHLTTTTTHLPTSSLPHPYGPLSDTQFSLLSRLNRFALALESFSIASKPHLPRNALRTIHTMQLHHQVLSILVTLTLVTDDEPVLEFHTPGFERAVVLAESIIASFTNRPSVCLDMGVILPLAFVVTKCPEEGVRARALRVLQSWPHREGPWESGVMAEWASRAFVVGGDVDVFMGMFA